MSNATVGSAFSLPKIAIAGAAVAALAFAPILLNGSIAHAATIQVGEADVAPNEIGGVGTEPGYNYDQWHIGNTNDPAVGAALFNFDTAAGITLLPVGSPNATQLIKGNTPPFDQYDMTAAELRTFIEGISVNVASGQVYLQIAGNFDGTTSGWTTLRPVDAHGSTTGTAQLGSGNWVGTSSLSGVAAQPLEDFLADLAAGTDNFRLYAVGVAAMSQATVASITFGGNTYNFAAAPTPGGVETAAPAADNGAFIAGIAVLAALGLAVGAVAVRRNVKA